MTENLSTMVLLRPRYGAVTSTIEEDLERLIPTPYSPSSSSFLDESLEEDDDDYETNDDTTIQSSTTVSVWIGLIVMAFIGVFAMISVVGSQFSSLSTSKKSNFVSSKSFVRVPYASTTNGLSVATVWNEYGEFGINGMLSYPFLSGSFLIEPYKLTTINMQGMVDGCTYTYTITSMGTEDTNISGTIDPTTGILQITLTKVGKYMLQVDDSCTSEPLSQTMWVKYVRRELSTLTDTDREEFLDAFHTLWEVNTVDGMAKYGERYKSLYYFAALHNDGGGNSVCDEFHGGVGFLNNHMYLSAYLEQSMQLVNPKVCLHYMEYTKYFSSEGFQKHLTNELDGGGWTELLSSKFFGANDPLSGRITDGRWAMTPIPYLTTEFFTNHGIDADKTFFPSEEKVWTTLTNPHLNSPYGLLRSPWNYNPDPYVTRFGNVWRVPDTSVITCTCAKCECNEREVVYKYHMGVQCEDYQVFFDSIKRQSLTNYLMLMEDDTHGDYNPHIHSYTLVLL